MVLTLERNGQIAGGIAVARCLDDIMIENECTIFIFEHDPLRDYLCSWDFLTLSLEMDVIYSSNPSFIL